MRGGQVGCVVGNEGKMGLGHERVKNEELGVENGPQQPGERKQLKVMRYRCD